MTVKVYKYAAAINVDFSDVAIAQLRLAHELRNELVAIHRQHEEAVAAAWREHPEVDTAVLLVEQLAEKNEEAATAWKKSKSKERDRKGDPELKAALTQARVVLKAARADLKEKKQAAYEALAPRFHELSGIEKAAVKATYRTYVDRGLYWATYNLIREQHMRAVAAMKKARSAGNMSELRFKRWTGEGQIGVQLQREEGDTERSPEMLASGSSKWRNTIRLPHIPTSSKSGSYLPMSIRMSKIDDTVQWLELNQVRFHRPLPPEGDIADVRVSRRRVAGNFRVSVEFTVKLPDIKPSTVSGRAGINIGWRKLSDGSIRVATWRAKDIEQELSIDNKFHESIIASGEGGEVRIPARYVSKWEKCAEIQGVRGRNLDILKAGLLKNHYDDLANYVENPNDIKQWRSPNWFARLAIIMREETTPLAKRLEDWRKQDRHLWEWEANQRASCVRWRKDLYLGFGALLADECSVIAVQAPFVATVKQKSESDDHQADAARRIAQFCAPSTLIMELKKAAANRGAVVEVVDSAGVTLTHRSCGHVNPSGAAKAAIDIICEHCGSQYDQDVNAAWTLMDRASGQVAAPNPGSAR